MNIFLFGMNTFYKWGLYQRNKMLPKPFLLGFSPALTHWHFNSNANENHHFSNKPNFRTISLHANYSKRNFGRVTTNGDWVYNQGFKYMFFHPSCETYLIGENSGPLNLMIHNYLRSVIEHLMATCLVFSLVRMVF